MLFEDYSGNNPVVTNCDIFTCIKIGGPTRSFFQTRTQGPGFLLSHPAHFSKHSPNATRLSCRLIFSKLSSQQLVKPYVKTVAYGSPLVAVVVVVVVVVVAAAAVVVVVVVVVVVT